LSSQNPKKATQFTEELLTCQK